MFNLHLQKTKTKSNQILAWAWGLGLKQILVSGAFLELATNSNLLGKVLKSGFLSLHLSCHSVKGISKSFIDVKGVLGNKRNYLIKFHLEVAGIANVQLRLFALLLSQSRNF